GKKFCTTVDTLTQREPDSLLAAMFSGCHTVCKDSEGSVFLDRDGKLFQYILNWLRNGVVPNLSDLKCSELLLEAEYYELLGLVDGMTKVLNKRRKDESSSIVRLNIGGEKFCTTVDTLTQREPHSMLAAMFSGRHTVCKDSEGYVFLDRDGKHFRHILNWLRDCVVPKLSDSECSELLREAEYYQLLGLVDGMTEILNKRRKDEEMVTDLTRTGIIKCLQSKAVKLRGVNLPGLDLSGLNLSHVDFDYACLKNVSFSRAYLSRASFQMADLTNANLEGANLERAYLTSAKLTNASLKGANLRDAYLWDARFQMADLTNANLERASLERASLRGAKLTNASLKGANLQHAYLRDVNLTETDLKGADLLGAII
ncbi:FH protein interacting protein FIP2, partial [Tanacetum coccineum]